MKESDTSSEDILQKAGYHQELDRGLTVLQTVGLSLSDITPAAITKNDAAGVMSDNDSPTVCKTVSPRSNS